MEKNNEKLFEVLLDMLVEFDRVCTENDIEYYLEGGTLLGAIRHKGFIPWDDDIDIMLERDQYEKLRKIAHKGIFKEPLFWQDPETDIGSQRMFSRLRNSNTTSLDHNEITLNMNHGIFIDIFPIDSIPNNIFIRKIMLKLLLILTNIASGYAMYYSGKGPIGKSKSKKMIYYFLLPFYKTRLITTQKVFKLYEKLSQSCNKKKCEYCGEISWMIYAPNNFYERKQLDKGSIKHIFEGKLFSIPKEYDKILKSLYGDYMTPKKIPTGHRDFYLTDCSYTEYLKNHYDEIMESFNLR